MLHLECRQPLSTFIYVSSGQLINYCLSVYLLVIGIVELQRPLPHSAKSSSVRPLRFGQKWSAF
jgi:hypothetical protein